MITYFDVILPSFIMKQGSEDISQGLRAISGKNTILWQNMCL